MPESGVRERVAEVVAEAIDLPPEQVGDAQLLGSDLAVDSLAMIEVVLGIEQTCGVTIDDADVSGLRTFADLVAYVEGRVPQTT